MRFREISSPQSKSVTESKKKKEISYDYRDLLEYKLTNESNKLLDKKTPTVAELAEKYKTSIPAVEMQLKKGIRVEKEHTSKNSVAREIALDHLGEDLHYYEKLAKVEKEVDECADDPDCDCACDENFADGRNPQDKGDSKRHNVPTKGKISTLRKIAKQGGRRGQLAHWMANMRSGKKKHNKE